MSTGVYVAIAALLCSVMGVQLWWVITYRQQLNGLTRVAVWANAGLIAVVVAWLGVVFFSAAGG